MRRFEIVNKYRDQGINLPKRATKDSAGYDIEAAAKTVIPPFFEEQKIVLVPTGIKAIIPKGEVLRVYNRSSNSLKRMLIVPNGVGVIDGDYYNNPDNEGEIFGQFMNLGTKPYVIEKGERIMQGIFETYKVIDDDNATDTRIGGFGSTGE